MADTKVIVLPTIGIGDLLMFTPSLRCVKRIYEEWEVDVFVMIDAAREVLMNNPHVDRLIYYPLLQDKIGGLKFVMSLRREKYDYSLSIFPSNKKEYNLVSFLIGARYRLGHRYLVKDFQGLNFLNNRRVRQSGLEHGVFENLKLAELMGAVCDRDEILREGLDYFLTPSERAIMHEIKGKSSLKLGVHPGSSSRKTNVRKRWPREKYVELIRRFLSSFGNSEVYIFGGLEERPLKQYIFEKVAVPDRTHIVDGSIREIAPVVAGMDLFLGNDSALIHLAAALKIPTAVIYGPSNPAWTYPFGVPYRIIRLGLECSPCYHYSPKSLHCPSGRDFACLRELPVDLAFSSIVEFIDELGLRK